MARRRHRPIGDQTGTLSLTVRLIVAYCVQIVLQSLRIQITIGRCLAKGFKVIQPALRQLHPIEQGAALGDYVGLLVTASANIA